MSDLDDKLHDLLYKEAESYYFEGSSPEWFEKECPELIEKFKQVFKDTGYVTPSVMDLRMDGGEWYDRFMKELPPKGIDAVEFDTNGKNIKEGTINIMLVLDAAKRAAGIE